MKVKVHITKWALTEGIRVMETESDTTGETICIDGYCTHFRGNEWHTTEAGAIARAEEMRLKKITSLQRSLAKMRALTFKPT